MALKELQGIFQDQRGGQDQRVLCRTNQAWMRADNYCFKAVVGF